MNTAQVLESLTDFVSSSPLTYGLVLLLVAGDAILPLFPGESAVVAAGVVAADGGLSVWLVALAAFAGAVIGDTSGYLIGRTAGERVIARFLRGERGRRALERAEGQLAERGVPLIAAAQFIPGGRNVMMIGSGALRFPFRRFLAAEVIGAALWAAFQTALGYLGGRAFDSTLTALSVSLGIGLAIGLALEGVTRWRRRRSARARKRSDCGPTPNRKAH